MVRMHSLNVLNDALGSGDSVLASAMQMIADEGRGVIVVLRDLRATSLSEGIGQRLDDETSKVGKAPPAELRDYGVGAQILLDLGVKDMILLSNTQRTIVGLEGYGLTISDQRAIPHKSG